MSDKDNNKKQQQSKIKDSIFVEPTIQSENKNVQPISVSEQSKNGLTMKLVNFAKNDEE